MGTTSSELFLHEGVHSLVHVFVIRRAICLVNFIKTDRICSAVFPYLRSETKSFAHGCYAQHYLSGVTAEHHPTEPHGFGDKMYILQYEIRRSQVAQHKAIFK